MHLTQHHRGQMKQGINRPAASSSRLAACWPRGGAWTSHPNEKGTVWNQKRAAKCVGGEGCHNDGRAGTSAGSREAAAFGILSEGHVLVGTEKVRYCFKGEGLAVVGQQIRSILCDKLLKNGALRQEGLRLAFKVKSEEFRSLQQHLRNEQTESSDPKGQDT
ncbi:hypothetical protein BDK51DRAFT_33188 [Blyttiomyces helicus]|uniref:Uncharacterized protein n=1 Tax=Blyttiomyces helicus TaxID=388810 RepID=A0A4P9WGR0_9FUNG|nr:hypothetical protein BDK51DRAFT_33188 [Blyttiomyces helicus]|eukprot:RKO91532.1 hypothetical protein BDK51DRAFT_33188 [Blyttiomyces helicus]